MSNNLNLDQLVEDQDLPAATVNTAHGQLDAAITEQYTTDMAGADKTMTPLIYRSAVKHMISGVSTTGIDLTLPAIRKFSFFTSADTNTNDFNLVVGSTTKTLSPGQFAFVYTDGTTNGLQAYSLVDATGLAATDIAGLSEAVQDIMAASLTAGSGISITYNDTAGTITIANTATVSSGDVSGLSEAIDDRVAALLVAGSNVSLTYNDSLNTLTIAASGSGGGGSSTATISAETSSRTLVIGDADNVFLNGDSSSPVVFTIPTNASVAFTVGTEIAASQDDTGTVSFAPDSGVTLQIPGGYVAETRDQYSVITIKKMATDTWRIFGDLGS